MKINTTQYGLPFSTKIILMGHVNRINFAKLLLHNLFCGKPCIPIDILIYFETMYAITCQFIHITHCETFGKSNRKDFGNP